MNIQNPNLFYPALTQNAYLHHVFDTSNAKTGEGAVKDLVDHDMPCAVCMAPNTASTIMIPGTNISTKVFIVFENKSFTWNQRREN